MQQIIIGITGPIEHGKSTFSVMLAEQEPSHAVYESNAAIIEIADIFNAELAKEVWQHPGSTDIQLTNAVLQRLTQPIQTHLHQHTSTDKLAVDDSRVKLQPELYEKLFAYLNTIRNDPTLLSQTITAANKETYRPLLQWLGGYFIEKISPNIWFDEIFYRIRQHDADKKLIIVNGLRYPIQAASVRNNGGVVAMIVRPSQRIADRSDPTEAQRSSIVPDISVINNGSVEELQAVASQVWRDALKGNLKKSTALDNFNNYKLESMFSAVWARRGSPARPDRATYECRGYGTRSRGKA